MSSNYPNGVKYDDFGLSADEMDCPECGGEGGEYEDLENYDGFIPCRNCQASGTVPYEADDDAKAKEMRDIE